MTEENAVPALPLDEGWTDCFADFKAHVDALSQWEVLMGSNATLEDLMSAPEIGDPKTDINHEWKSKLPLELVKGEIDIKKVTEKEVLELMDAFVSMESLILSTAGTFASTLQCCIFLFDVELAKENKSLYAYLLASLKALDMIVSTIQTSSVFDPDEFPVATAAPRCDKHFVDVMNEVESALAEVKNDKIKAHLTFKKHWLRALNELEPTNGTDVEVAREALGLAVEAAAPLKHDDKVVASPKFFRVEASSWNPRAIVPVPMAEPVAMSQAVTTYTEVATQLVEALRLSQEINEITAAIPAIEHFAASKPHLLPRARLCTFVAGSETAKGPFMAHHMHEWVLSHLSAHVGAPMYKDIFTGDVETITSAAKYLHSVAPAGRSLQEIAHSIQEHVKEWTDGCVQVYVNTCRALLFNPGRAQRALANGMMMAGQLQMYAHETDAGIFCAPRPLGSKQGPDVQYWGQKSLILFSFSNDLFLQLQDLFFRLTTGLKLTTAAETIPIMWCKVLNVSQRERNAGAFTLSDTQAYPKPQQRIKGDGVPMFAPIVCTRLPTLLHQDFILELEVGRLAAQGLLAAVGALKHAGLVQFELPETSYTTAATMFNHRFNIIERSPIPDYQLPTYDNIMKNFAKFSSKTFDEQMSHASVQLKDAIKKLHNATPSHCNSVLKSLEESLKHTLTAITPLVVKWRLAEDKDAAIADIKKNNTISVGFETGLAKITVTKN